MNTLKLRCTTIAAVVLLMNSMGCKQSSNTITIANTTGLERPDELVVLKRSDLEKKLGTIAAGKYVVLKNENGVPVGVQYDDVDGDARWDEIALLHSFAPNEKWQVQPAIADAPAAMKMMVRAHVRHMHKNADNSFGPALEKDTMPFNEQPTDFSKQALPPFLTEGPAWENDRVGFRLYFDVRNGKDIWGKTTSQMMMDEVGADTSKNYHQRGDWGMDILKVGASLGAGSLALQVPLPNGKDTLVRLGGKNIEQVTYEKMADGPVRALFRLQYHNWKVADGLPPVSVTEMISICGGAYYYESQVLVTGAPANAKLATGIVNLHSKEAHTIDTGACKALYTYDVQSENNDRLGMAILMPSAQVAATGATPNANTDVQNTYIISSAIKNGQPITFRFYAGWEQSDTRFKNEEGFRKFLLDQMEKWRSGLSMDNKQ